MRELEEALDIVAASDRAPGPVVMTLAAMYDLLGDHHKAHQVLAATYRHDTRPSAAGADLAALL